MDWWKCEGCGRLRPPWHNVCAFCEGLYTPEQLEAPPSEEGVIGRHYWTPEAIAELARGRQPRISPSPSLLLDAWQRFGELIEDPDLRPYLWDLE